MNCCIYARYSSHSQREASIEDQVRVCREEAERRGDRVIRVYADKARSGREATKRTEFLRMIHDAESGGWQRLYIYKRDRFARSVYDANIYRRKLEEVGVSVVSVMEPMPEGTEAIIMDSLLDALAEYYSLNLSQNIRRGLEGNALRCGHNGCSVYGYDLGEDGLYHVNETQAAYVLMAFEMYDQGKTTKEIAEAMVGQLNRVGKPFKPGSVAKMLKNDKYIGTYRFGDHVVENGIPAIVPRDLFERVNARLKRKNRSGAYYPLSGKLYDGSGRRFAGVSARGKSGKTYYYYKVTATRESYPKQKLEDAVNEAIAQFLASSPRLRDAIIEGVMSVQDAVYGDSLTVERALRDRIAEIDREADNLVGLAAKMGASDRIADQLRQLEDERADAQAELARVADESPHLTRELLGDLLDAIADAGAPTQIVQAFVSRITIDKGRMTIMVNVDQSQIQTLAPETELEGLYKMSLVETTDHNTNTLALSFGYSMIPICRPFFAFTVPLAV